MYTPLYSKILSINEKARFHMPGHSGNDFFEFKANKLDITEIEDMDNLLSSSGVILNAEQEMARAYGYKHSLMVTSGSTTSMQIVLYALKELKYSIIAYNKQDFDLHSSFYNACRLYNVDYFEAKNIIEINDYIEKHNTHCAIFVTSPNYFGLEQDLDSITKLGALLVVDAAHGAHFAFSKVLPNYPMADIAISSLHKTMPSQTGASIINVNSNELYDHIKFARSLIHSTSPNFMTMASMDLSRAYMEQEGERIYSHIKDVVDKEKQRLGTKYVFSSDISRLVIDVGGDAYCVAQELHRLGYDVEMTLGTKIVLILTENNIDALHNFIDALLTIKPKDYKEPIFNIVHKRVSINGLTPMFVDINDAEGYVCNTEICIYPPSIPIIKLGDIITKQDINILNENKDHLLGLVNDKVPVLK